MKRLRFSICVGLALLGACSTPDPGTEQARRESTTATGAVVATAPAPSATAVPVPFERTWPAGQAVSQRQTVIATGPDHPTADAPSMPPWIPDRAPTRCSAITTEGFDCPASAPNRFLCTSRADLPRGCRSAVPPGAISPPNSVPVCCL